MKFFNAQGFCQFGKHKGVHASKLPLLWADWASSNIKGFRDALSVALSADPSLPKVRRPTGRTYILKPFKRS